MGMGVIHSQQAGSDCGLHGSRPPIAGLAALGARMRPKHGTSPLRTEQDVREFPVRNAHLLAALRERVGWRKRP